MDQETFQRAEALFHELSELPHSERQIRLDRIREATPQLAIFVASLLETPSDSDFLEKPAHFEELSLLQPGSIIDDFEILSVLGEGAFGTVYLAKQLSLDRLVALKTSPDLGDEGRTMAPLDHLGIVKIFSQKRLPEEGIRLLCMQYVPGLTLDRLLSELRSEKEFPQWGKFILDRLEKASRHLPLDYKLDHRKLEEVEKMDAADWVIWLGAAMARALEHAHQKGVLHLDVKPGNILVHLSGRPLLSDFNVSVKTKDHTSLSSQVLGGTVRYMSPEQYALVENRELSVTVGPSSDLFSLGKVLQELWSEIKQASPDSQAEMKQTEAEAESIFKKLTSQEPSDRYQSAAEAAEALEACLERRSIVENLPPLGFIRRIQFKYPVFFFLMLPLFPQFIGSVVNITYNEIRIVQALTIEQRKAFLNLVFYYNVVLYPVCVALAIYVSRSLGRVVFNRQFRWEPHRDELCAQVTRAPLKVLAVVTLGWMPGAFFFPTAIDWLAGPIPDSVYFHFFASFTLSWLLSMTYCFLSVQSFNLRVLYPRFLIGLKDIRSLAQKDLSRVGSRLRVFHILSVVSPVAAGLVILWTGTAPTGGHSLQLLKFLLTFLFLAATAGFFVTFLGAEEISQLLFALTGRAKYRGRNQNS